MTRFTSSNAPRSPREFAQQKIQLRKQQEKLLSDLLSVVDALDHAADHWHQAAQSSTQASSPSLSWWQRWLQWLGLAKPGNPSETTTEVVVSARDGIDMIRESMLSVLSEHQVTPLPAKGHPFDPSQMHALGQQADTTVPPNTVVQEVVRGYRWQDRVLREAQ
ncbi:MAG: nucleotide exchange factor GrpE, partial [Cyanobacteria bacterium P01_A01_bin.114]